MSFEATRPPHERLSEINGVTCLGSGFVGACLGAVMAFKIPIMVNVVDRDADRIAAWNTENLPLSEPSLHQIIKLTRDGWKEGTSAKRERASTDIRDVQIPNGHCDPADSSHISGDQNLCFTTDVPKAIKDADMIFICVNTPSKGGIEGEAADLDLRNVKATVKAIAEHSTRNKIVVLKSTVPCGTAILIQNTLDAIAAKDVHFEVLSNPEFLAEGRAIRDLLNPDRIVIGSRSCSSGRLAALSLASLYAKWVPREQIVVMDTSSAELSKLASNALLAQRISAANALSVLCEKVGADIGQVTQACGLDSRIGPHMFNPGPGFGGGCLEKDVSSLVHLAESQNLPQVANFWQGTLDVNEYQKHRIPYWIKEYLDDSLHGKRIAILGFTYKKNTSDCRNSPAVGIGYRLTFNRASVAIYDSQAEKDCIAEALGITEPLGQYEICRTAYEACMGAVAVILVTDWDEFCHLDWKKVASNMKEPKLVYDARNVLDHKALEAAGLWVEAVGKASSLQVPNVCQT